MKMIKSIIAITLYGIMFPIVTLASIFVARKLDLTHNEILPYSFGIIILLFALSIPVFFIVESEYKK